MTAASIREAGLSEETLKAGVRVYTQAGSIIFRQEDVAEHVYYVEKGIVRFFMVAANGTRKVLCYAESGNVIGELGALKGRKYGATAVAVVDTALICYPREQFLQLISTDLSFAQVCIASLARKLWAVGRHVSATSFQDRFGRVATWLAYLAEKWGERAEEVRPGAIRVKVTHRELAELSSTCRVTVSNVLRMFEDEGLIQKGSREIIVKELRLLKSYSHKRGAVKQNKYSDLNSV